MSLGIFPSPVQTPRMKDVVALTVSNAVTNRDGPLRLKLQVKVAGGNARSVS